MLKLLQRFWMLLLVVAWFSSPYSWLTGCAASSARPNSPDPAPAWQRSRAVQPQGSQVRDLRAAGSNGHGQLPGPRCSAAEGGERDAAVVADVDDHSPAASANIVAQGDGDSIRCRITVDGVVQDEKTTDGLSKQSGTPLEGSKIYLAGTASMYKDMQHGSTSTC